MTYTSPLQLYKVQRARFASVDRTIKQMHREIAQDGLHDAEALTSGGIGPQWAARRPWLRKTRPFARRRPGLLVKPLPIGMITGRVNMGFVLSASRGHVIVYELRNRAPHAQFILHDSGTRYMRGRGLQAEITKRWRARNKALIDTVRARQKQNG
jgi:hypothetical protein